MALISLEHGMGPHPLYPLNWKIDFQHLPLVTSLMVHYATVQYGSKRQVLPYDLYVCIYYMLGYYMYYMALTKIKAEIQNCMQ